MGLLILRLTVTLNVVAVACHPEVRGFAEIIPFATLILSILLSLGLFSWACSWAMELVLIVCFFLQPDAQIFRVATVCLLCLVLALAGPGGYSIDALLWAPRRITYPEQ
jgi:uncharacterized membrane protein YphA (DoxX/SURF4 family)